MKTKYQNTTIYNPTISLCMIVKDEEHNLHRCLDSVAGIVDEMIIVDTGSTDRTVEIAKSYGAKVFYQPWEGSFSKARNYSLKYATCEWILYLDADEELRSGDSKLLKEIAKNSDCTVVSFIIYNKYKNSTQKGYARMVRFFKNFSGIYYEGIVHNAIIYNGKCLNSPVTIIHHGYNLSEERMHEKFLRTSTLLKKQIESDPFNPLPYRYIGISYMDRKMFDDAIESSRKAISIAKERGFNINDFIDSYYIVSAAYFEKAEFNNSEFYALRSVELDNQFLDGYCILSFIYYNLKKYDDFIKASENYLTIYNKITYSTPTNALSLSFTPPEKEQQQGLETEIQTNFIYHTIGHKWKLHLLRGFYYLSNNQKKKGDSEIDIAIKESTDMEDCLTLLGNFYMERNCIDSAEGVYKRTLKFNQNSFKALFKLGYINFQKNNLKETISFWKRAVQAEPESYDIRLLICKINISEGNIEDVLVDCEQLLQILNLHRNMTIDNLHDLADIFNSISKKLKEKNELQSAETAYRICNDLQQIPKYAYKDQKIPL